MTGRCVLDASAVLAWLFQQQGGIAVEKVLKESVISTVNLAEVLYRCDDRGMAVGRLEEDLLSLGVGIEPFGSRDSHLAIEVRKTARLAGTRLSLGDCCCLATGIRMDLPVITGDQAWEPLELGIEIHSIR